VASIRMKGHVGADGTLNLQVPTEFRDMDVEVLIALTSVTASPSAGSSEGSDWPGGFFATTFGSCADDPLIRPEQ
jgi:hypothetical protein